MRNRTRYLALLLSLSTLFMTGCSASDMDKLNRISTQFESIAKNVNTIAEKSNSLDTEQINESIASITESVEELNENTSETVEIISDVQEDLIAIGDNEITDEIIREAYEGTPIASIMDYSERGETAINDAKAKYEEGMALFIRGRDGLYSLQDANKSIKGNIESSFDYTIDMINGGNMIAEGISLLLNEYSKMGKDILNVADVIGMDTDDNDELLALKAALYITQNETEIYFIDPKVIDTLENTKEEILSSLDNPEYIDEIDSDAQIDELFDSLKIASTKLQDAEELMSKQYKRANKAAQSVLTEVQDIGTGDEKADATIDLINETLKAFENVEISIPISDYEEISDDIDSFKDQVKDVINQSKESIKKELKKN